MFDTRKTAIASGVVAAALIALFAWLSPGSALWWTFIPAMVIAYAAHLMTTNRRRPDPDHGAQRVAPRNAGSRRVAAGDHRRPRRAAHRDEQRRRRQLPRPPSANLHRALPKSSRRPRTVDETS